MSLQKEDVYETEDPLPSETVEVEEQFDDQDIEQIHVDIDGALKLFGSRLLNADDVDFSDPLLAQRRKRRGYRSGNYVLEFVGASCRDEESLEQKVARIKAEIEELSVSVKQKKSKDGESVVICKEELNSLNDLLKAAILQENCDTTSCKKNNTDFVNVNDEISPEQLAEDPIKMKDIAERIQRIEDAIVGGRHYTSRNEPLVETLENLQLQVDSLNPLYLDGVQDHLNSVIRKLAEFESKRKKVQPDELEEKINKLYKLVTEWDATCQNVPAVVKRLYSLSKLHEQAQNFSMKLNDLVVLKEHLDKKTENQKVMLFELKRESSKIITDLSEKVKTLENRILKLSQ